MAIITQGSHITPNYPFELWYQAKSDCELYEQKFHQGNGYINRCLQHSKKTKMKEISVLFPFLYISLHSLLYELSLAVIPLDIFFSQLKRHYICVNINFSTNQQQWFYMWGTGSSHLGNYLLNGFFWLYSKYKERYLEQKKHVHINV